MGKSELRAELIRFCDSIRNYEHESGHSIYQDERESSELVDIFLALPNYTMDQSEDDSHSPTEPITEFDTLQRGDYFIGTRDEYKKALSLVNAREYRVDLAFNVGFVCYSPLDGLMSHIRYKITQLTAPEFIRRAENTFKKG